MITKEMRIQALLANLKSRGIQADYALLEKKLMETKLSELTGIITSLD